PGTQQPGLYPWYEVPGRVERDLKIVCGHWSALGLFIGHGVHAIDTGAVWGGKLTALQLDTDELRVVQGPGRNASPRRHPAPPAGCRSRDTTRHAPGSKAGKTASAPSTTVSTCVRCRTVASGKASAYTCAPPITHSSPAPSPSATRSASSSDATTSMPANGTRP